MVRVTAPLFCQPASQEPLHASLARVIHRYEKALRKTARSRTTQGFSAHIRVAMGLIGPSPVTDFLAVSILASNRTHDLVRAPQTDWKGETMSLIKQEMPVFASDAESAEASVYRKVSWRLLPFLGVLWVLAWLDRVNIGFAKLQMLDSLHFSEAVYGLGAGIFFIGYFLFEVPSNMLLQKIGAKKTIMRITICWGIICMLQTQVNTPTQFYILRFLLGAFEAGFYPGVIL
jgi:hypothetical protein